MYKCAHAKHHVNDTHETRNCIVIKKKHLNDIRMNLKHISICWWWIGFVIGYGQKRVLRTRTKYAHVETSILCLFNTCGFRYLLFCFVSSVVAYMLWYANDIYYICYVLLLLPIQIVPICLFLGVYVCVCARDRERVWLCVSVFMCACVCVRVLVHCRGSFAPNVNTNQYTLNTILIQRIFSLLQSNQQSWVVCGPGILRFKRCLTLIERLWLNKSLKPLCVQCIL